MAEAVRTGLGSSPKTLPSLFFYDDEGSALFDLITQLPEYTPTRCELEILQASANEIVRSVHGPCEIVEFGSGSGVKTRTLIEAALGRQGSLQYVPIDVSGDYLRASAAALLADYPELEVTALAAEYRDGLAALPPTDRPRLVTFMGSNLGNMEFCEAAQFLGDVRAAMGPHDRLLLGVDLVKDTDTVWAAYNDRAGVTERFNKNVLARVNRELGADFDLEAFGHWAPYVPGKDRIEMHLVARREAVVRVEALGETYRFEAGESVRTEISQKYTLESLQATCLVGGFGIERVWHDRQGWFAVALCRPVA